MIMVQYKQQGGAVMKINDVEKLLGITKANIRFYEKEGLLTPGRMENGYREYSEVRPPFCRLPKHSLLSEPYLPL